MIILDLLFLFDSLSDIKRPFYQAENPIAIGNEKKFKKKKRYSIKTIKQKKTIYGLFRLTNVRCLLSKLLNERQLLLSFPLKQRN